MTARPATHRYTAQLAWAGSTGEGYDRYSRAHEATCAPGDDSAPPPLPLSADPAFGGDPAKLNTIAGDAPDDARLTQLVETAHRHCFIANSLTTEVAIEPSFRRVPA